MNFIFRLILLSSVLPTLAFSATPKRALPPESIREIIENHPDRYSGQNGYIAFADQFYGGNMETAYKYASEAFGNDLKFLSWGKRYRGSTQRFWEDRSRLVILAGVSAEYRGREGYRRYAQRYYAVADRAVLEKDDSPGAFGPIGFSGPIGQMQTAHQNVSAALTKLEFAQLDWGRCYLGTTKAYEAERQRLFLDEQLHPGYSGRSGYVRYASTFGYESQMQKAFINVSAVLSPEEFAALGWSHAYNGSVANFRDDRIRLYPNGRVNRLLKGILGYERFARLKTYGGNMAKAFANARAVTEPGEFAQLGWGRMFMGQLAEKEELRDFIFDPGAGGQPTKQWDDNRNGLNQAVESYALTSDGRQTGLKIRKKMRAAVSMDERFMLGWIGSSARKPPICVQAYNTRRLVTPLLY